MKLIRGVSGSNEENRITSNLYKSQHDAVAPAANRKLTTLLTNNIFQSGSGSEDK